MGNKTDIVSWRKIHKWAGIAATIFILLFCISGILLNHRPLIASYSVSRSLLPKSYRIEKFNNGIIKGTIPYKDKVLAYGCAGIWLTDRDFERLSDFNDGFPKGVDNRNIRNVIRTTKDELWCASQFGVYRFDGKRWQRVDLPDNGDRIADITTAKDGIGIVILTRSAIYTFENDAFIRRELQAPAGYDHKVSLFKTVWQMHSGELFGMAGRIVVDVIAVIIIFLCLTGIALFVLPYSIKMAVQSKLHKRIEMFRRNHRLHSRIGYYTMVLTLFTAITGMCLRPPLMIPLALMKTSPVPMSALDSKNVWQDKLRSIRWDADDGNWLISTSEGFFRVDNSFACEPEKIDAAPPISPMGVNVLEPLGGNEWLIGSFSGMYRWNTTLGAVTDYFSGEAYSPSKGGRPVSQHLVSGYSDDLAAESVVFDWSTGADSLGKTPELLKKQPMSLWNFALELHVGRCYSPLLGPLSELFVFASGVILTVVLLSGFIIHKKRKI